MRCRSLAVSLLLLTAACGGSDTTPTVAPGSGVTADAPTTTGVDGSTAAPGSTTSTLAGTPTDGPAAPALSTILSDGTPFDLADHSKPVYLIFWAEW